MTFLKKIHFRNAAGAPATPPATPPADPPVQTRTTPPPAKPRTADEISTERGRLIAEAEQLQTRSQTTALTEQEETRLDECITQAEALDVELRSARRAERIATQRSRLAEPTRPAPQFTPAQRSAESEPEQVAEPMRIWLRSFTDDADRAADASYRAAQGGFHIGSPSARIACDFGGTLNRTKRRTISKGGAGTGAELIPQTYSGKVTEYITYFSPLLGLVDSEVTADGNDRDYFVIDDTALISDYITASVGTELNPTIPDADVTTGSKTIKCFDITSGYHKLTRQALRDSAITLTDKVTKAIGNSHARRMERDVILGTGTTMPDGLVAAAAVYGAAVADFDADLFEGLYFSVPQQYRSGCVWLMSDAAMARAKKKLKDTTGRTLFDKTIEGGAEILTLHNRPVYTSSYMAGWTANAKPVLFFNPLFYMLRLVAGQSLDVLREKFYPHLAYAGGMAFGGSWLGPSTAIKAIQLTGTPAA